MDKPQKGRGSGLESASRILMTVGSLSGLNDIQTIPEDCSLRHRNRLCQIPPTTT